MAFKHIYHFYAGSAAEAAEKARREYPTQRLSEPYLDDEWKNPCRWCVEVLPANEQQRDDSEEAR